MTCSASVASTTPASAAMAGAIAAQDAVRPAHAAFLWTSVLRVVAHRSAAARASRGIALEQLFDRRAFDATQLERGAHEPPRDPALQADS